MTTTPRSKYDLKGDEVYKEIKTESAIYMPVFMESETKNAMDYRFLKFDPHTLLSLLEKGDSRELCIEIVELFKFFDRYQMEEMDGGYMETMALIAKVVLRIFADKRFKIPQDLIPSMIYINCLISNLVRISSFKTTDLVIKLLLEQDPDIPKIMTLYSARNELELDLKLFYNYDRFLATLWWATVIDQTVNSNSETIYKNMMRFLHSDIALKNYCITDPRYRVYEHIVHPYFWTSYYDPPQEPVMKPIINREIRKHVKPPVQWLNPDYKKILLISWSFRKEHAVYRCMAPLIYSLKGHYHITQVCLDTTDSSKDINSFDLDLVDEFLRIDTPSGEENEATDRLIRSGKYGIVFYPDVGMNFSSIAFANTRLAPIQIATYGHPVSTWHSEIDYFIGGVESELPEKPERNYSERLVLIPGLGTVAVMPEYKRQNPKRAPEHEGRIMISCSWGSVKFNYKNLLSLKKIVESTNRKICFYFMGIKATRFQLIPFAQELYELLGKENVKVSGYALYDEYVGEIEYCDFGLDAFPFGSYNRIVDTLIAGKPIIVQEGDRAYNRFASAILRRIGQPELIADTDQKLVDITLRMIEDDEFRKSSINHIETTDIKKFVSDDGNFKYYKKAFDYLVENHNRLKTEKSRKPIIIEPD